MRCSERNERLRLKLIIEVSVGVVPGVPLSDLCRRWHVTDSNFEDAAKLAGEQSENGKAIARLELIARVSAEAAAYATSMMRPDLNNWVKLDWLWM
jgi:hypothetical protein